MAYCSYYQATTTRSKTWFFVAVLRSFDHMAFDRTLDVASSTFEFFVPEGMESHFVALMHHFEREGLITDFKKLDNRLKHEPLTW